MGPPTPSAIALAINVSVGVYVLSVLLPLGFRAIRMRWARDGFLLLVFMVVLDLLGHRQAEALAGLFLIAGSAWCGGRSWRLSRRLKTAWLRRWREGTGITVALPFRGRWKALNCGPNAAKNHHLAAPDQWFAADFVREDGAGLGSEILSPLDGRVAYVEDGHPDLSPGRRRRANRSSPAGNYISIEIAREGAAPTYLLICHLQQRSIRVEIGACVRAGDVVGLCGNSGNTTAPHLHIHAQDRAQLAVGLARGLPLRFGDVGEAEWLEPGRILVAGAPCEPSKPSAPA